MSNWSITRKLIGGFGSALLLVAVISGVAMWSTASIRAGGERAVVEADVVRQVTEIQTINWSIFGAEKNMILGSMAGDSKLLEVWTDRLQGFVDDGEKRAITLASLVRSDEEKRTAQALVTGMKAWGDRCAACHEIAAELKTRPDKVLQLSAAGEALMQSNGALIATMKDGVTRSLQQQQADAARTFNLTRLSILATILASGAVAFGLVWLVRGLSRTMSGATAQLSGGAQQLVAASGEVSASSQSLAQGATEQAASLEETSASMQDVASITRANSEHSRSAADLMGGVCERVDASSDAFAAMVASMEAIQESSQKVSNIIRTIDEIAFQTNILALNAAVEAARAGEAGLGFAVVADEVRNLAQRSAQAAKDTTALIDESITRARAGTAHVEHVTSAMSGISDSVTAVKSLVDDVYSGCVQQTTDIDHIARALQQIEQVTQTTAAGAEEAAAAS